MSLIGLEISDAGILAAAGTPGKLVELEEGAAESPGFALPEKKGLLVGKEAEGKAHLFPRQILNRFWDRLNADPLDRPGRHAPQNHAEIVFTHLDRIWQVIRKYGDEIVLVVPDFYDRQQLGLILGIAQELSMNVKGFVPLSLAATSMGFPGKMILHLDIHLHRIEVIYLKQGDYLTVEDSIAITEKGLVHLYREWVEAIAQEFVRNTRFDPLHKAASEQELYDRLPAVLTNFRHNSSTVFDISAKATSYNIALKRDLLIRKAESIYSEVCRLIEKMRESHGNGSPVVLQLSHRLSMLPGFREMLATVKDAQISELERGAAAIGVLRIWQQLSDQRNSEGISFFTSRPWHLPDKDYGHPTSSEKAAEELPTHLLYRNFAYPISEKPLVIGKEIGPGKAGVMVYDNSGEVSPEHCALKLHGREVILEDYSDHGTFVNESRVSGSVTLTLGQIIRLGINGEQLRLIACLKRDET